MDYAEELKKDLLHYRSPINFARDLYRTIFENNVNFPKARKYASVMSADPDARQAFFDVYHHFLSSGNVSINGLEQKVRSAPVRKMNGLKRKAKRSAYVRGIDVGFDPFAVGTGAEEGDFAEDDEEGEDDGDEEEDEKPKSRGSTDGPSDHFWPMSGQLPSDR